MLHGSHWSNVDGRTMHARVAAPRGGSGERPLVLVHGLGVSSAYYVPLLERLGRQAATWAPDLPGHGRTPAPGGEILEFDELARTLEAWLDANHLRSVTLAGNSLGGQLAAVVAARRRDIVDSLVLLGPTTDQHARSIVRHAGRLTIDALREPPGLLALELVEYLRCGPRRVIREFLGGRNHDLRKELAKVSQPVTLVRGERDPISTGDWLDALETAARGASRVTVAPAAHAAHWSHPEQVASVVAAARSR
ncbi:MAG: alpha/beta hydrolase fold [Thermoleophilia bacterium]|nr:alpha/beta hydrolase fold [Thermoleophilia bacterium]